MNKRSRGRLNRRQIARAWSDPVYRATLTSEQRRQLPRHPAGVTEEILDDVRGWGTTALTCNDTCAFSCSCTQGCETYPITICGGC